MSGQQEIFAFDNVCGGTDVFFSHQYLRAEDAEDSKAVSFFELWWTPKPKCNWWATAKKEWVYMGKCSGSAQEAFYPMIWGTHGAALRIFRGKG